MTRESKRAATLPSSQDGWFAAAVRRCRKADPDFPQISPHDLRHTAASLAISTGANVEAVQRMLGHASAACSETRRSPFETVPRFPRAAA